MASVTIKNVPDHLMSLLKRRAKENQRSLNSEIIVAFQRHILREFRSSPEEIVQKARDIRSKMKFVSSDDEITKLKNEGRE